jgi:hypothetical protein
VGESKPSKTMNKTKNTPAFTHGQDKVHNVYADEIILQPILDLPVSPQSLVNTERMKRITTDQIALSLLTHENDKYLDESKELMSCAESIELTNNGKVKTFNRCKRRLCALCSKIEADKWTEIIRRSTDHLSYTLMDDPEIEGLNQAIAIKLTLNAGQTCHISELKTIIKDVLHPSWPSMMSITAIKPHLLGAMRATEIQPSKLHEDGTPLMNPHIHGVILLKAPDEIHTIKCMIARSLKLELFINEITLTLSYYWKRAMRRKLSKHGLANRSVSSSVNITPLTQHTNHDLAGWLTYCTKGAICSLANSLYKEDYNDTAFKPISQMWIAVERATKGIRFISASKDLKSAITCAKDELKRATDEGSPRQELKERITHRWSFTRSKYIPEVMWDQPVDKPSNYRVRAMMTIISKMAKSDPYHQYRVDRLLNRHSKSPRIKMSHDRTTLDSFNRP